MSKLVRRDPARTTPALSRRSKRSVRGGDVPQAVEMARAALDAGTIHPMLLNLRSHWHGQQGRPQDALNDLQTALVLAPHDIFVRNALGVLLERMGRFSEAQPILEESVRLTPDFPPAQYALGWLYAFTGELDAARGNVSKPPSPSIPILPTPWPSWPASRAGAPTGKPLKNWRAERWRSCRAIRWR